MLRVWVFLCFGALLLPSPGAARAQHLIQTVPAATLRVGQSAVVTGLQGECGRPPRKSSMPRVRFRTGYLTYGGAGVRRNPGCGGYTPAVEAVFVADSPGSETITLYGDQIRILVTP